MELHQLAYVIAVSETLNFGRAAEQLGVGQPAVSQQIARLERELGVVLFNRTSRVVTLSEAGQRFVPAARAVLVAVERARLAAAGGGRGHRPRVVRLGSSTGLGDRLDALLEALRRSDPDIDVELRSAPTRVRLDRVRAGQLDAAFVRGERSASGLELVPVWQDPLVLAVPAGSPAAGLDKIELADLRALPLRIVSRRLNAPLVDLVMTACSDAGFEPILGPPSTEIQDTLAAIGAGAGWTVVYAAQARTLHREKVAFRALAPTGLEMTTYLAVPAGPMSLELGALLRACAAVEHIDQRA